VATPSTIIASTAALMNDTVQSVYTNAAVLPYFNIALKEMKEVFAQNNVPITNETTTIIEVPAGTTAIIRGATVNDYPTDLIEIQRLWESTSGLDKFSPMTRKDFLASQQGTINQFVNWAWMGGEIRLPEANQDNDLKIDYVRDIVPLPLAIGDVDTDYPVLDRAETFLIYKTASICSMFIGENESRAGALGSEAVMAMDRALGTSHKGRQAVTTRHRPFRAGWKSRGYYGY
jgi:hypothetical protein